MHVIFIKLYSPSFFSSFPPSCIVVFSLIAILLLGSGEAIVIKLPPNVTVPAVIVFGDSIMDQGNNNHLNSLSKCNHPPYGKDFPGGIATGRFNNGLTPSDLIVAALGIKDLLPASLNPSLQDKDLLTGVSFASGGAGYDPQTSQLLGAIPLSDQLKMFKEYIAKLKGIVGEERTSNILANSLHFVVLGSNDLVSTYFSFGTRKYHYSIASYSDFLVNLASSFIQEIYKLGARRISIFSSAPIGCLPGQRTLHGGPFRLCDELFNQGAELYNTKLSSGLDSLRTSLPQAKLVYIDIYNPLLDMIQNPQRYGFDVADRGCCGTGEVEFVGLCSELSTTCPDDTKYLFWDTFHPTERGYRILIDKLLPKSIQSIY